MATLVKFEVRNEHLAIITFDRPKQRNAVNAQVAKEMEAALDKFEADDNLWIGIITGNGPTFCAGADLKALGAGLSTARGGFAGLVKRARTKPLIAAVDGPALAGGTEVVLSCDLVVASEAARFGLPEVKRGLAAAAGGLFRLPRVIPPNVAMEAILTGDPISVERAHQFGMVNQVVPKGEALTAAVEMAGRILENAPVAVQESRKVAAEGPYLSEEGAWDLTGKSASIVFQSPDFIEGPRAFAEKRKPKWTGQRAKL